MARSKLRNLRLDDELYDAVCEKAELEGRGFSSVVRDLLTVWVQKPPAAPVKPKLKTWKD